MRTGVEQTRSQKEKAQREESKDASPPSMPARVEYAPRNSARRAGLRSKLTIESGSLSLEPSTSPGPAAPDGPARTSCVRVRYDARPRASVTGKEGQGGGWEGGCPISTAFEQWKLRMHAHACWLPSCAHMPTRPYTHVPWRTCAW